MRYAFIPGFAPETVTARAIHQYVDIPVKAKFLSGDEELNRIFDVAAHTFMLCSGAFFLDGIKRDKWIWGGDAYQSLFVNRYLTGDAEIEKRTLIALRGGDPVTTHVNTILDYSLLWIMGVYEHVKAYNDADFLRFIYPKMESLMALCMAQREEHGFVVGRKRDWVFIDWADFDRDGPLCAEQMLLCECYRVMAEVSDGERRGFYASEREKLIAAIEKYYWNGEKGAYIDSFTSGNRRVTRHANIFAILFDIADEERKKLLLKTVLLSSEVPAITTPYFRFFELEALCRLGQLDLVLKEIKSYWGGMLKMGATTFWEEYDPGKPLEAQYEMYGDPYGKSLCHAWAASPIYFLMKYFADENGEYLPVDAVLYSGEDPALIHNEWPSIWARMNREAIEEYGKVIDANPFAIDAYRERGQLRFDQGDKDGAAQAVNKLRERAHCSTMYSASEMDIHAILDERIRELIFEEGRWFTFLRMEPQVWKQRIYDHAMYWVDYKTYSTPIAWDLWPIPQNIIDLNTGAQMDQNPGWK